jgi:hypothetical protein
MPHFVCTTCGAEYAESSLPSEQNRLYEDCILFLDAAAFVYYSSLLFSSLHQTLFWASI